MLLKHICPNDALNFLSISLLPVLSVSLIRHKQHGSRVLIPLGGEVEPGHTMQEVAEAGRATLWCQVRILNLQLQILPLLLDNSCNVAEMFLGFCIISHKHFELHFRGAQTHLNFI